LNQILLDAFPCVALLLRPQTREIIASNNAAVKVGALPGAHCFSTWGQRQDPCPWCLAPALWATGDAQHLEVEALGIFWDAHWIPVAEDLYMHFAFDITERKKMELQLKESEENMRYIVKHDPNAIAVYDRNLQYIAVSNRYLQDYNVKQSDIIGKHHYEVFPEMPQRWKEVHARCLAGAIERNDDDYFERPDGSITYNRWECRPWYKSDGEIGGMITYTEVTTERKKAELALRESEEKYRLVVENAAEIILVAQDGLLKYVNPMAVKILGYPEEALTSMPFVKFIHPEDVKKVFEAHMRIMKGEENQPVHQFRVVPRDGTVRWADSRAVVISWEGKLATVNFITDITDRKRMEEEILSLSITDQLTGLYNRRGFLSLAGQQLKLSERNKSGVLLFFADLDLLKWINDTMGHEEGDKALIEAATVFRETFRTSDIVARLGGDEFAVLAVNLTDANSKTAAARLQQLIDIRNNQENRRYRLSISMGCAYYDPENPCSIGELIARADKLMYEQKQGKQKLLT